MAETTTFNSLKDDLKRYLERGYPEDTEVVAQIPRLINAAERAIASQLKILGLLEAVTSDLTAGVSVYAKPDRWRETVSMAAGTPRRQIFARGYEYCRTYWPDETLRDVPEFYADYDYLHWLIVPTPVATIPWEIMYYQLPQLLDNVNQSNWLSEYAPNVLLYRSLLEATPFLKNDERIQVWEGFYRDELGKLDVNNIRKVVDRNTTRQGA
jgi:hypothetical protein